MWGWQDFYYTSGNSEMDSRRAAFWLFDFINEFNITDFRVISSFGEWQNQRIEIAYKIPQGTTSDRIEDLWSLQIEKWIRAH